jgi:hypothetical protein
VTLSQKIFSEIKRLINDTKRKARVETSKDREKQSTVMWTEPQIEKERLAI